jgi:hypothetical protein
MEEKRVEEIVDKKVDELHLFSYEGVSRYRSIRRAMRRGNVTPFGTVAPKRPFNNRSISKGTRPLQVKKRRIYEQLKHRFTTV